MRFDYQAETFATARRYLMAPHSKGDDIAFVDAYLECLGGLHHFDVSQVSDDARSWIDKVQTIMSTEGIEDPKGEGTGIVRARQLTFDEKLEFSRAVDELASYFEREFWSDDNEDE